MDWDEKASGKPSLDNSFDDWSYVGGERPLPALVVSACLPCLPCYLRSPDCACCQGAPLQENMGVDPEIAEEVDKVEEEPGNSGESKLSKTGYPEIQKDVAPSQNVVPAGRAIARHSKKLDALLQRFTDAEKLSELQEGSDTYCCDRVSWLL